MNLSFSSQFRTSSLFVLGSALMLGLGATSAQADNITLSNATSLTMSPVVTKGDLRPYPSPITVSGARGKVTKVTLTLNDISHTSPADLDILLVTPSGQSVLVMSDTGATYDLNNVNLTFDDDATTSVPSASQITSGTYRPTDYEAVSPDTFGAPAPAAPYGTTLASLNGNEVNGDWKLFVTDGAGGDRGQIDGGWTLNLTYDPAPGIAYFTPDPNQKIPIIAFSSGFITGFAVDNTSVSAVKVRLSRKRGGVNEFWNGTTWVTDSLTFVDADLTGAGNPSAAWNLGTNLPPQNKLDAGQYGVRVYAVDNVGGKSANLDRIFTLYSDNVAPGVSISTPTSSQVVNINSVSGATFSGTASDNVGVSSVKLKLGRKRNNVWQYWNGSDFTTVTATFDAALNIVGGTSVSWQLASAIPADKLARESYALYATAYDAAGNKTTSASRLFAITGNVVAPDAAAADASSAGKS